MSYILDALRRADAERERDPLRGIHAQPATGVAATHRRRVPGWAWPAGAVAIVAVAAAVAWERPGPAPVAAAPTIAQVQTAPEPVMPAPVAVAETVSPPAPPPLPAPPVERPRVQAPVAKAAAPAPAPVAAPAPAVVAAVAPVAIPPAPAAERVYNFAELPPDVQRDLPKLAIAGGVHSENAAQRMLIVGGQVVNEGAEVAPGLVLEQIRARTAVLRFRGYRYSVPF